MRSAGRSSRTSGCRRGRPRRRSSGTGASTYAKAGNVIAEYKRVGRTSQPRVGPSSPGRGRQNPIVFENEIYVVADGKARAPAAAPHAAPCGRRATATAAGRPCDLRRTRLRAQRRHPERQLLPRADRHGLRAPDRSPGRPAKARCQYQAKEQAGHDRARADHRHVRRGAR